MNYIQPTRRAFIVPQGVELKRQKKSKELKKAMDDLNACMDKEKSTPLHRVYIVEVKDDE